MIFQGYLYILEFFLILVLIFIFLKNNYYKLSYIMILFLSFEQVQMKRKISCDMSNKYNINIDTYNILKFCFIKL